jgi:uncharacterized protein
MAGWLKSSLYTVGVPALCLAYASGLALAWRSVWKHRLRPLLHSLALAGRMSLTHYVGQSIFGVMLFYGYGAGLWGRVGAAWSLLWVVAIFTAQVLISVVWMGHFRHGPLEWLWRSVTYGRLMPMLRTAPPRAAPMEPRRG